MMAAASAGQHASHMHLDSESKQCPSLIFTDLMIFLIVNQYSNSAKALKAVGCCVLSLTPSSSFKDADIAQQTIAIYLF